jgi:hypothetical protein
VERALARLVVSWVFPFYMLCITNFFIDMMPLLYVAATPTASSSTSPGLTVLSPTDAGDLTSVPPAVAASETTIPDGGAVAVARTGMMGSVGVALVAVGIGAVVTLL